MMSLIENTDVAFQSRGTGECNSIRRKPVKNNQLKFPGVSSGVFILDPGSIIVQ